MEFADIVYEEYTNMDKKSFHIVEQRAKTHKSSFLRIEKG